MTPKTVPVYAARDVEKAGFTGRILEALASNFMAFARAEGDPLSHDGKSPMTTLSMGRFITFEGGEGTGKSTQIKHLCSALETQGIKVVQTREPGGSPQAEAIRDLLVNGDTGRWHPATEALLHFAARNEHLERVVRPALEEGSFVVCDRFSDSTMAYQA